MLKFLLDLGYGTLYIPYSELASSLFPLLVFPVFAVKWSKFILTPDSGLSVTAVKFIGLYILLGISAHLGLFLGHLLMAVAVGFPIPDYTLTGPPIAFIMLNLEMALAAVTYFLTVIILLIMHAVNRRKSAGATPDTDANQTA